jgi:hypothetical protein
MKFIKNDTRNTGQRWVGNTLPEKHAGGLYAERCCLGHLRIKTNTVPNFITEPTPAYSGDLPSNGPGGKPPRLDQNQAFPRPEGVMDRTWHK